MNWFLLGLVPVVLGALRGLYRSTPFLSQDWRVVVAGNADRWRYDGQNTVTVWLVRRLRRTGHDILGTASRIPVGEVKVDDPDFDEKLIELKFKAAEMRTRMRSVMEKVR